MVALKSTSEIAKKWATVTPMRSEDYKSGVTSPRVDWQTATLAGSENWKAGVTAAAAAGRFATGVANAGTAKWKAGALEKGVNRWGEGVQKGESAYAKGFQPYRDALASLSLPPRYARRDPRNLERVRAVFNQMIGVRK